MLFPNGTDGSHDNIEEVEIWEPLSSIIEIKIANVEELEDWEPLSIIHQDI